MRKPFVCLLTLGVVALFAQAALAGENWIGTWKLNAAKSTGTNAIRAQTIKFESTADGIKISSEGVDADGKPMVAGYTSKFDGKDVPWAGNPMADTAAPKKIDDNNYENVWKKAGKATVTGRQSDVSLYDFNLAIYDEGDSFDQSQARGFIEIYGMSSKLAARRDASLS